MTVLMATGGMEAFYLMNGHCQYRRTGGPLPEGAAGVFRREAQRTTRCINTTRTEYACHLVSRQETAEFDLGRDRDIDAATQLHGVA